MIQPNELRLDNWVKDSDDKVIQVSFKTFELLNDLDTYSVYPIPLTEEILLKCGFEKYLGMNKTSEYFVIRETKRDRYINHLRLYKSPSNIGDRFILDNIKSIYRQIKYLHEVQNLYLPLTGKELVIKL